MRSDVENLVDTILDESDCIDDLIDAIREQRDSMRDGDEALINELMNEIQDIFFETQTKENIRTELTKKLASKFVCNPDASSLVENMTNEEKVYFNMAVDKLTQSVFVLKSEMLILNGLIDQNARYTSMLLSEYRRLVGEVKKSGSSEFRG